MLGLRDVMDEPGPLEPEWERKNAFPALRDLYDEIWVYGLPQICDPLDGIDAAARACGSKMVYTGYLQRTVPAGAAAAQLHEITGRPSCSSPPGGGGDGEALIDWVLRAYEHDPRAAVPALLVLGPFMQPERQAEFTARAAQLKRRRHASPSMRISKALMARAAGVVAMGGYNTFCEVLSFDKRGADRAAHGAAARAVHPRPARRRSSAWSRCCPTTAAATRAYGGGAAAPAAAAAPVRVVVPGLLDGLEIVNRLALNWSRRGARWRGRRGALGAPRRALRPTRMPLHRPTGRVRSQGLSAPLRDLYRAGDRGAGAARARHPHRVAAPSDRPARAIRSTRDPRAGALPAGISASTSRCASCAAWRRPRGCRAIAPRAGLWLADLRRDPTPNRVRRFGQALVLAAELPSDIGRLHAHFLHTPASVARYAAMMRGLPWSVSAHAKDIWTTPEWEKREKLAAAAWLVTCTRDRPRSSRRAGAAPGASSLAYHGLDFARFPPPPRAAATRRRQRPGAPGASSCRSGAPSRKKATTFCSTRWRCCRRIWLAVRPYRRRRAGGAAEARRRARLGLAGRIEWRGARAQPDVLAAYREADLFVLAAKIARDGDRDGLPNVLMEAQSQRLACVATAAAAASPS